MHTGSTRDVVVVGAGVAGLLAAAWLRGQGWQVRVLAGEHPGGRARSLLLGGVPVNPGPRAIYAGGPLMRGLAQLGVVLPGHRPATTGLGLLRGKLAPLPASLISLWTTSLLQGGAERREAALVMARITMGAFGAHDHTTTIAHWLQQHVRTAGVRALVMSLVRLTTYAGEEDLPAALALTQLRMGLSTGVHYVDGGWSSMVEALVSLLQRQGVAVDSARADRVTVDDNDRLAVHLAGETLHPAHVVVATSLSTAQALCGLPARALRPVTASCLDLVCDPLPFPERRFVLGVDVPRYFSVHTPRDRGAVGQIVHAMSYGTASQQDLEAFVDIVQPGLVVRAARYLPKMVVHDDLPGTAPTPSPSASLHFVGAAHGTALLADGAAESAARIARRIGAAA